MKVRLIGLTVAIVLTGCSATPAPVVQRVEVPVPVPCVSAADLPLRPAFEVERLPTGASDGEKILALARDWPSGRKYEAQMAALLGACVK